jgi:hypothetical protein
MFLWYLSIITSDVLACSECIHRAATSAFQASITSQCFIINYLVQNNSNLKAKGISLKVLGGTCDTRSRHATHLILLFISVFIAKYLTFFKSSLIINYCLI